MTRRSKKTGRFIRSRRRTSTRRKSRRRGGRRTESWSKRGRVRVRRNRKGQFVTWRKIRGYRRGITAKRRWGTSARTRKWKTQAGRIKTSFGGKGVAVYGGNKRIQMRGSGIDLYKAMKYVVKHPPKEQFLDITAEEVLHHPERFLEKGYWAGRPEIESR